MGNLGMTDVQIILSLKYNLMKINLCIALGIQVICEERMIYTCYSESATNLIQLMELTSE